MTRRAPDPGSGVTLSRRQFLLLATAAGAASLSSCSRGGGTPAPAALEAAGGPATATASPTPMATDQLAAAEPLPSPTPTATLQPYSEAPMLAARVAAGELPPVVERLPVRPALATELPMEWLNPEIGAYGGELRLAGTSPLRDEDAQLILVEALLSSPGGMGDRTVPNILESFVANDAGTEFGLTLRAGLRWSDGSPVTTEDVRFAWEDVWSNEELHPEGPPSQYRAGGRPSGGPMTVEILDTYNFKVSFSGSYGGFPTALAIQDWRSYRELLKPSDYLKRFHAKYANRDELGALATKNGVETWTELFLLKDIGSQSFMSEHALELPTLCPWVLVDVSEAAVRFERNPYYFKVDAAGNQLPYFDTVGYVIAQPEEELAAAHFEGEVDYACHNIVMSELDRYRDHSEDANYVLKLATFPRSSGVAFLNLTYDDPGWRTVVSDVRFRQALSHAIDRTDFIETLYFGLAEPSHLNPPHYAPDLANQLLDEMEMQERDADGWRLDPEGNPFSIDFACAPDLYDAIGAARLYMFYWQSVGLNCTLQIADVDLLEQRARENAHKATVHFDYSPLWFCQNHAWIWWGPLWNLWWESGGESGEEPPDAYKSFRTKVETIMAVPPEVGRATVAPEVGQMLYEQVWYIVPTANQKRPRIESRDFGNVTSTEDVFSFAQTMAMEQVFWKTDPVQGQEPG